MLSSTIHKVAALQPAIAQAKYCSTFQLTHMPRGYHTQSIASNGDRKEDKTLLQHSQLRQHGEFRHVSVSERQRYRLYLHHQGEFQHKNCTLGSLNDSNHDGVGRFFVGHSQGSVRLFIYLFTRGNRTPGSRDATGCNSLGGHSLCGNETLKVEESARAMTAEGKTKVLITPLPR